MRLSRRPEPLPPPPPPLPQPRRPTDFGAKIGRPVQRFRPARMTWEALKGFGVVITPMDFDSGNVDPTRPRLLRLLKTSDVLSIVNRIKPWIDYNGATSLDDFRLSNYTFAKWLQANHCSIADRFAMTLGDWAGRNTNDGVHDTLLGRTAWRTLSEMTSNRWLGVSRTDRYIWLPGPLFQPFKSPNQLSVPTRLDPEKPHIISYVVDSTPFDQFSLRSSEVKTIILVARFSHAKAESCHLDYFGVTAIAFCACDVRIVQGLVNFKTHDIDIRVTEVQRFNNGIRNTDGSVDKRFLTLLAYNSADVLPLPKP